MAYNVYEIPLVAKPQRVQVLLSNIQYILTVMWRAGSGWVMDIADQLGNPILQGVPLVTGTDLLGQYAHLGIGGSLVVSTDGDPDAVPTYDNLGTESHLYFVVKA